MLKHQFVEFQGAQDPVVETVDTRDPVEAARRSRELGVWRFRFYARRWHDEAGSGGWSDPVEHSPWTYVDGDIADPDEDEVPEGVLRELNDRRKRGLHTILLLLPNGEWEFTPPGATIMFDR